MTAEYIYNRRSSGSKQRQYSFYTQDHNPADERTKLYWGRHAHKSLYWIHKHDPEYLQELVDRGLNISARGYVSTTRNNMGFIAPTILPRETTMNLPEKTKTQEENFLLLAREDYYCIEVMFGEDSDRVYTYRSPKTLQLEIDDLALCPISGGKFMSGKVVKVMTAAEALNATPDIFFKWVAGKINLNNYDTLNQSDLRILLGITEARQKSARQQALVELGANMGEGELDKLLTDEAEVLGVKK